MAGGAGEVIPVPGQAEVLDCRAGERTIGSEEEGERVGAGFLVAAEHVDQHGDASGLNRGEFVARVVSVGTAEERVAGDVLARTADGADGARVDAAQDGRGKGEAEAVMRQCEDGVAPAAVEAAVWCWAKRCVDGRDTSGWLIGFDGGLNRALRFGWFGGGLGVRDKSEQHVAAFVAQYLHGVIPRSLSRGIPGECCTQSTEN
jgi:hypothetical protein